MSHQTTKACFAFSRRSFVGGAAIAAITTPAFAQRPRQSPGAGRMLFEAAANYSAAHGGVAFLVVRNGVVLSEAYGPDVHQDARWPIGTGTRMLAPLLAASLVQDRALNIDEPVALTLGEFGVDPARQMVTVRHLLNGTSGLAFPRGAPVTLGAALSLSPVVEPGTRFIDDAAAYVLFAEIARRKLVISERGQDPARYLTDRTLGVIGALPIGWTRDGSGAARFDDGAHLSARSWALAGELFRRDGIWRAREIADSNTLSAARASVFPEPRAGMGFWISAHAAGASELGVNSDLWAMRPPAPEDLVMAAGAGGQRLFIAPSENLVVVRLSRGEPALDWSDAQFLALLSAEL